MTSHGMVGLFIISIRGVELFAVPTSILALDSIEAARGETGIVISSQTYSFCRHSISAGIDLFLGNPKDERL